MYLLRFAHGQPLVPFGWGLPAGGQGLVQARDVRVLVFWVIPTLAYGLTFVAIGLGFRSAEGKAP
jgi:hypothetical protein